MNALTVVKDNEVILLYSNLGIGDSLISESWQQYSENCKCLPRDGDTTGPGRTKETVRSKYKSKLSQIMSLP